MPPRWRLVLVILLVYGLASLAFKYLKTPGIALGQKLVKRIRYAGLPI